MFGFSRNLKKKLKEVENENTQLKAQLEKYSLELEQCKNELKFIKMTLPKTSNAEVSNSSMSLNSDPRQDFLPGVLIGAVVGSTIFANSPMATNDHSDTHYDGGQFNRSSEYSGSSDSGSDTNTNSSGGSGE